MKKVMPANHCTQCTVTSLNISTAHCFAKAFVFDFFCNLDTAHDNITIAATQKIAPIVTLVRAATIKTVFFCFERMV
jgi:hypothetical protein